MRMVVVREATAAISANTRWQEKSKGKGGKRTAKRRAAGSVGGHHGDAQLPRPVTSALHRSAQHHPFPPAPPSRLMCRERESLSLQIQLLLPLCHLRRNTIAHSAQRALPYRRDFSSCAEQGGGEQRGRRG